MASIKLQTQSLTQVNRQSFSLKGIGKRGKKDSDQSNAVGLKT